MPDLRNRHDEPTGAIYGVLNMLRRLHQDYPADYSACVFDAKGKTFRDDSTPITRRTARPCRDDLARQIEPLHDSDPRHGLAAADGRRRRSRRRDRHAGVHATRAGHARCIISTGDKDMAQLVNDHVTLVNTMSQRNAGR